MDRKLFQSFDKGTSAQFVLFWSVSGEQYRWYDEGACYYKIYVKNIQPQRFQ